jgi:hypothetical protein
MHSDWLFLCLTAIIGFFCGVWLYTTVFVPQYIENPYLNELQDQNTVSYTINAEEYGECESYDDCRAFSLAEDRSYRYLGFDGEFIDGRITRGLNAEVQEALNAGSLLDGERVCNNTDQNHIRYSIYYDDNYYVINACSGAVAGEPVRTFARIWEYLIKTHTDPIELEGEESTSTPILQSPTDVLFSEDVVQ